MSTDNILYRMYRADGTLLYVGITLNPCGRFRAHRNGKTWWSEVAGITLEHFESRSALQEAERSAVRSESPVWNAVQFQSARRRSAPPTVTLRAVREMLNVTPQDIQHASHGLYSLAEIEAFEAGNDFFPTLLRVYTEVLGLPAGAIATGDDSYEVAS